MTKVGPLLAARISAGYGGRKVLDDFRLDVNPGETVGLVGESGSGKSTAALALIRLAEMRGARVDGEIVFGGRNLNELSGRQLRCIRGREIAMVLQSPLTSLNPVLRIGTQLREAWRAHERADRRREETAFVEAMESVNLPGEAEFRRRYPGQLSVGQAQRVLIAMAILHHPRLLIADEPTSALDMITQAEVLRLFGRLSRERSMAILYISHDLLSVASLCGRVAILERGFIVETAPTDVIFHRPEHPYTRRLVDSIPSMPVRRADLESQAQATRSNRTGVAEPLKRG